MQTWFKNVHFLHNSRNPKNIEAIWSSNFCHMKQLWFQTTQIGAHTSKFRADRPSSIVLSCPVTEDVPTTLALFPWIKVEAWPVSISNWDCSWLICLCSSKASALYASVASLNSNNTSVKREQDTACVWITIYNCTAEKFWELWNIRRKKQEMKVSNKHM